MNQKSETHSDKSRGCHTCKHFLAGERGICHPCAQVNNWMNWSPKLSVQRTWGIAQELADEPILDTTSSAGIKPYIADEAKRIVDGSRRAAYGTPEQNFERIARFWQAYFLNTGREVVITAEDVSPLMRLMKEARLCESPAHLDSYVDLVGYTLTGAEVNKVAVPK